MSKVAYDIPNKYLIISMQINSTDSVPLGYVNELYSRFLDKNAQHAIKIIENFQNNEYNKMMNENPFIFESNWMDFLLGNEPLPALV